MNDDDSLCCVLPGVRSIFFVIVCHFNLIRPKILWCGFSHLDLDRNVYIWYNILTTVSVAFSANKHQKLLPRLRWCHGGEEITTVRKIIDDQKKQNY